MKLQVTTLLFMVTLFSIQLNAQDSATSILETAITQAKAENKNVFVKYSASWCGWCKKMDKNMKNKRSKAFFDDNYVTVVLVVNESEKNKHLENPGSTELLKTHHGEKSGLPFWVILDENGDLIEDSFDDNGENLGCPSSEQEVEDFIAILQRTSNLTEENLDVISEVFLKK